MATYIKGEMEAKALRIATIAHDGIMRNDRITPYIEHPIAVANNAEAIVRENFPELNDEFIETVRTIALLHDVVEDTPTTLNDLRNDFPDNVIRGVDSVTRRDDKGETYLQFVVRSSYSFMGTIVKIGDLMHNLSTLPEKDWRGNSRQDKYELAKLYFEEKLDDLAGIYTSLGFDLDETE